MMKRIYLIVFAVFSTATAALVNSPPLEVVKEWNVAAYNFEWDAPVNDKSFYTPENIVTTGVAIGYDRIFIANPRLFSGVPATISAVSRITQGVTTVLEAYPNWSFHTVSRGNYNCSDLGLVSVYRLKIDSCNRLWALDAGVSRSLEDYEITCPPKILVFDLNTNQVVRRIDLPREVRRGESLYTNLIIDETTSLPKNNCDDAFVYISDTVEPAIVVYDSARDLTWRLTHPAMYPDPDFAQTEILNDRFTLMDGIVGLAFDAKTGVVYFQPLATDRLFSISTAVLRAGPPPQRQDLPIRLVGRKSSQGIGLAVSPMDGTVFFSPMTETAIAQWNPTTNQQKVLGQDQERLQFVADLLVTSNDPGALYVVSSKFHRFFLKTLNNNEINTRILRIEAYNGTPIETPQIIQYHYNPIFANSLGTRSVVQTPTVPTLKPFFTGAKQPYSYEPVGIVNRAVRNPFLALNTGEVPARRPTLSVHIPSYSFPKVNPLYQDYNNLRLAKSISLNTTSLY